MPQAGIKLKVDRSGIVTVFSGANDIGQGSNSMVAYLVAAHGSDLDTGEVRSWLGGRLPHYMIPAIVMVLDELPLTANRKVDRRSLPEPPAEAAEPVTQASPATEMERRIAAIWREELNLESVGVHQSFFELGGTSLLLARVHGRLLPLVQGELPIVELFDHPTISALAARLTPAREEDRTPVTDGLDAAAERARRQRARRSGKKKQRRGGRR